MPISRPTTRLAPRARLVYLLTFVLALIGTPSPPPAFAQPTQAGEATGELELSADQFGLGNTARAGGWIALRARFRDNTDRPREIVLQAELRDADGDRPVYRRVVTANPGRWQQATLYVYLPYRLDPSRGIRLTAREATGQDTAVAEGDGDAPQRATARAGRLIAEATAMPGQILTDYEGMLGIVGDASHGLPAYSYSFNASNYAPLAHERTEVVSRLAPLDLPDRWLGLAPFEILVWSGGDPADLGPERSRALREWVERGGHLVIVVTVENLASWTTSQNNLLRDLFPAAEVRAAEGVDLNTYRNLITRDVTLGLPRSALVHTFEPLASAGPYEAMPILNGPQGECLVVRRIAGQGMVTAVGMGVGSRVLSNVSLPAADVFWNRVLGRRGQFEPLTRLNDLNSTPGIQLSNRSDELFLDRDLQGSINLVGQSLAGVVLAFAVFGLYWLVAGPGGFALLKKTGNDRHAWVGFVAAAALFTGIAWGGATIIKPKNVQIRHVTILDHVYGQEVDRARSWMSILVPSYLGADVSVQGDGLIAGVPRFYEAIAPWEGRADTDLGAAAGSFPDARPYDVESRAPDTLSVPTRATVKQFQVDWAGAPQQPWPTPEFSIGDGSNSISIDPATNLPAGVLTHNFPGTLTDVQIIVIRGQQTIRDWRRSSWVGADGRVAHFSPTLTWMSEAMGVYPPSGTWDPGTPLDLSALFSAVAPADRNFFDRLGNVSPGDHLAERLAYASFFHQLETPELRSGGTSDRFHRIATYGLDLSRWFSQPCVIVLATLNQQGRNAMPIPVTVRVGGEDRTLYAEGPTMIRWIFPLAPNPPNWPAPAPPDPTANTTTDTDGGPPPAETPSP